MSNNPISINELLANRGGRLGRLGAAADAAARTVAAVQEALPEELRPHVWSASLGAQGVLTVVTDTGGWATRIRYAAPGLAPAVAAILQETVARVAVRVRPRPG
jgi:hypothetical protein